MTEQSILYKRVKIFDGLRAVAILGVFNIHFFSAYSEHHYTVTSGILQKLFATLHAGIYGVPLFFMLSGYLIYGRYLAHSDSVLKKAGALNFLKKRIIRLVPVYWLCLLVLFLIPKISIHVQSTLEFFANLTIIFLRVSPEIKLYNPVSWSLAIEFQYAFLVGISMLYRGVWRKRVYFGGLIIYSAANLSFLNAYLPLYSADNILCLFFGSVLYELREFNPFSKIPPLLSIAAAFFVCFMYGNYTALIFEKFGSIGIMSILDLLIFILLSNLISTENFFRTVLESRPLVSLGKISYSYYLFHYWTIGYLMNFVLGTGDTPWEMANRYFICMLTSIAVASVSYLLAEYPTIQLNSKKFIQPG